MQPAASCSLVFVTFLCRVQCQCVQFVENGIDSNSSSTKGLLTTDSDWRPYDEGQQSGSVQFVRTADPVSRAMAQTRTWQSSSTLSRRNGRRRRQAYYSKNSNFGGGPFSWSHYFTIPPVYSNTKESAYVREENMKRLKNTLEKDTVFQFLNPTGLRILIPADKINIRIVDFRFKLNEEFRGNDRGHYAPTGFKRGGLWTYEIPDLQVQQGEKVYYLLSVRFKEGTDANVNGVLEVTRGNPHTGGFVDPIPFRPTTGPVLGAQPQLSYGAQPAPTLGGGFGGGTRGTFIWNHQFTINATYGGSFTQTAANSWMRQAELLKISVQNIDFQFSNPTGLMVLIPDSNVNMRIEDFCLKVNEEFRGNDGGHYAPTGFKRGGMLTYSIPQLKANQGDRIFYSMRVKLGKEEFDTIVRGVLVISQGDPHKGGGGIRLTPAPVSGPQPQAVPSTNDDLLRIPQAVRWEHRFTINTTYNADFTQDSATNWFDEAQLFKNTLEKDIEFQFMNPTGLSISISGDNEGVKILAFNIKLNEEFRTLGPGNFVANISRMADGRWRYYYPNLKLKQGDRVYYWMRVTLGKQAFDNIVKGVLEVTQGDPHIGGPVPPQPTPALLMPQPPPSTPPGNRYPPQQFSNRYPVRPPSNSYPTPSPPDQNPSPPDQYSSPPPPNRYPPQQFPNRYPVRPPSNSYPTPSPPDQNPSPPPPNRYPPTSPPNQPSQSSQTCLPSVSTTNKNGDTTPPCQGQIVFEPKFNTLDGWTHQISIGGQNLDDEFTSFTKYDENVWVQQGRLNIKPTLLEKKFNDSFVRGGDMFLPGCTLFDYGSKYCHRRADGFNILPPVNSARINSQNMFTFRYGIIEMRAKLPRGDWLVPELWLEPTNPAVEERIVIGVSMGNAGRTANQMAAGVIRLNDKRLTLINIMGQSPWFQRFHTFRLEWTQDHVKFFVDDQQVDDLPADSFAVFSQEVYISLGVHAGGSRDFADDLFPNKPWKNLDVKRIAFFWDAKKVWYPSWKNDSTLQVEYIRVTAL